MNTTIINGPNPRLKATSSCCSTRTKSVDTVKLMILMSHQMFNCFKVMPYIKMECDGTLVEMIVEYNQCNHGEWIILPQTTFSCKVICEDI